MKYQKIGVFDSGIGGLTVLRDLKQQLPEVDMVYLGDCARLPYGTKSQRTIVRYSLQCAEFLVSKGIDLLVVACNTASAHALGALREQLGLPVVGVVHAGARAAAAARGGKRIGVIGTSSTIASRAYERALAELVPQAHVFVQACPLFVPLVEEGWCEDAITQEVARRYLAGLREVGIDTLLLGCTHYPLLKDTLSTVLGPKVEIVDSALSTALEVTQLFGQDRACTGKGDVLYYLTDTAPRFIELGELFLGHEMKYVYEVDLEI